MSYFDVICVIWHQRTFDVKWCIWHQNYDTSQKCWYWCLKKRLDHSITNCWFDLGWIIFKKWKVHQAKIPFVKVENPLCFLVGNHVLWAKPIYILCICCLYFPITWDQNIPIIKLLNEIVTFLEFWATLSNISMIVACGQ